ncbi:MAG: metallophosphoesterase [Candidatus Limiplasma sp.]|nr:metallophosphoesterase [Candidatus Limiplasma sp.]
MRRKNSTYIFAPEPKKRNRTGCLILFMAIGFAVVVLGLLTNAAMNRRLDLQTEKVRVMSLDKKFENFTLLHISDLHGAEIGLNADAWRSLLYGKDFSAVVMTGDMVGAQGDYSPLISLVKTLRQIKAGVPVYLIAGDEDPTPVVSNLHGNPEVLAEWVRAAQEVGAVYLDRPVSQSVGKQTAWFVPEYLYSVDITGMQESLTRQKQDMEAVGQQYEGEGGASYRALCYRLDAITASAAAIKTMTKDDLQIGLTHVPLEADYVREMIEWADESAPFSFRRLSLVLAGHYCGGQWRLGSLGPVYVPEKGWFPGDAGVLGMQRINSISQYISAGISASHFYPMPGRLFNTPSVALLTYTARIQ